MALSRFILPVCALAYLPLACSSTDDGAGPKTPAPPSGGSSSAGSSSAGTGGAAAGTTATGGSSGATTGGGSGMACTTTDDCMGTGFVCRTGMCACTADVPDVCGSGAAAACVNTKSNPDYCGNCTTKCDAGATCVAGACTPKPVDVVTGTAGCLYTDAAEPTNEHKARGMRLAIQGTTIYFTEPKGGKVRSVAAAGGAAVDIATSTLPTHIVADAKGIYWLDEGGAGSKVMKKALPIVAGAPEELVTSAAGKILGIAVHSDKLYYSLGNDVHQVSTTKGTGSDIIVGTAVNYDAPAKIEGEPHGIAVNDTMVAWTDVGDRNGVEGDDILVESATPLTDKSGYVELAQSVGGLGYEIAVDATYAYWIDGGRFVRNKLAATAPVPDPAIMESPKASPLTSFTITAENVYAANGDGLILRHSLIPPAEGMDPVEPAPIARGQLKTTAVVTDGTKIYWASDCVIRSTGK